MKSVSSTLNSNKIALWTYFLAEKPADNKYGAVVILGTFKSQEKANNYWNSIDTSSFRLKKMSVVGQFSWLYGDNSTSDEIEYVDETTKREFKAFNMENNVRKQIKFEREARERQEMMEKIEEELDEDESLAKYAQYKLKLNTQINTHNLYVENEQKLYKLACDTLTKIKNLDEKYPEYQNQWEDKLKSVGPVKTHPNNFDERIEKFEENITEENKTYKKITEEDLEEHNEKGKKKDIKEKRVYKVVDEEDIEDISMW